MATFTHGTALPDTANKTDFYATMDTGTVTGIVNADVSNSAAIADTKLAQITTASKVSGAALTSLASIPAGAGVIPAANVPPATASAGMVVQVVNTQVVTTANGSTIMPADDTIPQNTEGDEYMTLAITPTSATNKLKIEVLAFIDSNTSTLDFAGALFQDSTANALCACTLQRGAGGVAQPMVLTHYMTSGTSSATTFKFRAGVISAGNLYFNSINTGRIMGGVLASSITITEVKV
jgi:hypothetical protein